MKKNKNSKLFNQLKAPVKKNIKFTLILLLIALLLVLRNTELIFLTNLVYYLKFVFDTLIWFTLGIVTGALVENLWNNQGAILLDQNEAFLKFCQQSNGLCFFGPIGTGKTALLAMLAQELPDENKYATFPCSLPWAHRSQLDFSVSPDEPLPISQTIFIDETNLLFKGNIIQDVRQKQRMFMHFMALSRQMGVKIFANGQRLGQFSVEQREITTAICNTELLKRTDRGIYTLCTIWSSKAWSNEKTQQEFVVFIAQKYLNTYDSYWLKALKYLRNEHNYV